MSTPYTLEIIETREPNVIELINMGPRGLRGEEGVAGGAGPQGVEGPRGPQGPTGPTGAQGQQGQQGIQGVEGPQGLAGTTGATGATGPQGVQGEVGLTGPEGPTGPTGDTGPQGIQGVMGPQGDQGNVGPTGIQGPLGPVGPLGLQGPQGDSFDIDVAGTLAERALYDNEVKGFTFYATDYEVRAAETPRYNKFMGDGSVAAFVLDFTPDGPQSLLVTVGGVPQTPDSYTVGIVGPVEAETYTFTFNTAPINGLWVVVREVTLSTGYGAIFFKNSNTSGDWSAPVPFGKGPRGDAGPEGPVGPQGDQGVIGETGPDGLIGPVGATGPQGATGETGARGIDGPQGPIGLRGPEGATGPTGDIGPQGEQGEQGQTGIQGPEGPTGPVGPQGPIGATGDDGEQGPVGEQGPTGNQGIRGSRAFFVAGRTSWSVTVAVNDIPDTPLENDISTQYDEEGFSESRAYDGTGDPLDIARWTVIERIIDKDLQIAGGVDILINADRFNGQLYSHFYTKSNPPPGTGTDVVISTGSNALGGYRLWQSGRVEQWGRKSRDTTYITFPTNFSDSNYHFIFTGTNHTQSTNQSYAYSHSKTKSDIRTMEYYWEVDWFAFKA